ncbi:ribosome small subunit-dependent GTPase A [Geomicrobium sp. JCM 19038]|uniref:ribosome small subunit-dependent GTPase A n=1 Tax=Geomicrobium sp. JCM 19038 TaxID=1460635 RepID=UPI00045F2FF0|nr:ribosome small subunit-dependent GTPase A [Geomicrobium sp. JCM 19038]GAK07475.1 ribosome small subunit-stimulated GTPase EngC [Geomicrobium sp. JCM 19038]
MQAGQIIKAVGGFYDVLHDGEVTRCRARGLFRKQKIKPLVGDFVTFEEEYVQTVESRSNEMHRPPIANVNQALLVMSSTKPEFSTYLLDRLLVHTEAMEVESVIIISKMDLASEEIKREVQSKASRYESLGYTVVYTPGDDDLDVIREQLKNRTTVVAGQSGVGKSTLLNRVDVSLDLQTGEISQQLSRGKHTTRHVELLQTCGGQVADTPGFSSLDFTGIDLDVLADSFLEIYEVSKDCKYRGCTHRREDGCAVKAAVETDEIAPYRYDNYLAFYNEKEEEEKRRF